MLRIGVVLGALASAPVLAQQVPDPGAPPGAEQTAYAVRGFDRYALPVAPFSPGHNAVLEIEGQVVWAAYRIATDATTAEIMDGYAVRLATQNFEPMFACDGEVCGGFDYRFGATLLPPPGMLIDVQDFVHLTAQRSAPEAYVSVLVSRVLDHVYVQTVAVVPSEPTVEIGDSPSVEVVPDQMILPVEERALLEMLRRDGHVPVSGLEFAPGGAALSEASAAALDMLARMLSRDSDLSVVIVGHSDNQGGLDANIALSQRRAQSVMDGLIARGVPNGQLDARGIGYLAPVTSNTSPEGRASNRRVELVLR